MGEIIDLKEYKKQKEAEAEQAEEDKTIQVFVDHAKSLDW